MSDLLVGVDIGGSTIAVLIADEDLTVAGRYATRTHRGRPEQAAEQVADAIRAACAEAQLDPTRIAAVGVGVPGRVETLDGVVSLALNLGWHEVPLGADMEHLLGVPCLVANDVRAAAGGLVDHRRVLGDIKDLVYISVGTGIAAGVVLDGQVQVGAHAMAGEIGHFVVDPGGALCVCGLRGCLETVATGPAIAARAAAAARGSETSTLGTDGHDLTSADVYVAAAQGDPIARLTVQEAGMYLARVIYHLAVMVDPERVCLGGGVAQAGAGFLDPIERELDHLRRASSLAAEVLPADLVHLLPRGADAGAWGALLLARKAGHRGGRHQGLADPRLRDRPAEGRPSVATLKP